MGNFTTKISHIIDKNCSTENFKKNLGRVGGWGCVGISYGHPFLRENYKNRKKTVKTESST
jgi:hypothetical protein